MKSKTIIVVSVFLFSSRLLAGAGGGDTITPPRSVQIFDNLSLIESWLYTSNSAAYSELNFSGLSLVQARYSFAERGIREAQEPGEVVSYNLLTRGIKKVKDLSFYGEFSYLNERYNNLMYNGTLRFNNWSPYSIGDTLNGRQFKEEFNLHGIASYSISDRLTFGTDVNYSSTSGAKQKDPRNLNTISSLTFSPAIIFKSDPWAFGLSASVFSFNEENSFSVIGGDDPTLFLFLGLGYFKTESNIYSYSNAFFGHGLGTALQAVYERGRISSATEVSFNSKTEEMRSGSSYRIIDGIGYLQEFMLTNQTVIRSNRSANIFRLKARIASVSADEVTMDMLRVTEGYLQYDSLVTLAWIKNKQLDYRFDGDLSYTFMTLQANGIPDLDVSGGVKLSSFSSDHYPLATYGSLSSVNLTIYGHFRKTLQMRSLTFNPGLNIWYRTNLSKELKYKIMPKSFPEMVSRNFDAMSSTLIGGSLSLDLEKPFDNIFVKSLYMRPVASYILSPDSEAAVTHNYLTELVIGITF